MFSTRAFVTSVVLTVCTGAAVAQTGSDIVKVRKGGVVTENADIVVIQDDLKGVKARKGPATVSFSTGDVVEVVYGRAPTSYKESLKKLVGGEYEDAIMGFEDVLADEDEKKAHPWLQNYCLWNMARAEEGRGEIANAVKAYGDFVAKVPTSRFIPDAILALGNLLLESGKADEAMAQFTKLGDLSKKENLGSAYMAMSELGAARVSVAKNDPGAVAMLEKVAAATARDNPEIAGAARLEIGMLAVAKKDFPKAELTFQSILREPGVADRVWAGAASGLGDVQYEQKKFMDAAFTYSKVYAMFREKASDHPAIEQAVGWALYRGGKSADLHSTSLPDSDENKSLWRRRGKFLQQYAFRYFNKTKGGQTAAKELGLLGSGS